MFRAFKTPDGILLYNRKTGLNILLDSFKGYPDFDKPVYAQIQVTNRCNLHCSFCSQDSSDSHPHKWTFDEMYSLCKFLDEWGLAGVALGGGEPFTFPRLAHLVRRIYDDTDLDVSVTSNGLLITEEDLRILSGHIGEVRVSCWSKQDISKVKRLLGKGIPIGVNIILFRNGVEMVKEVINASRLLGVEDILILECRPSGRAGIDMAPEQKDVEDLAAFISELGIQVKADSHLGLKMKGLVPYVGPWTTDASRSVICITHDGFVKPNSFSTLQRRIIMFSDIKSAFHAWRNHFV